MLATFAKVIDDPAVTIAVAYAPVPSAEAKLDPAVVAKVERVTGEMWPGAAWCR